MQTALRCSREQPGEGRGAGDMPPTPHLQPSLMHGARHWALASLVCAVDSWGGWTQMLAPLEATGVSVCASAGVPQTCPYGCSQAAVLLCDGCCAKWGPASSTLPGRWASGLDQGLRLGLHSCLRRHDYCHLPLCSFAFRS